MNPTEIGEIVDALRVQLDPESSHQYRMQANDYLNSVLARPHVIDLGFELLSRTYDLPVRYYGAQLLVRLVNEHWKNMGRDKKNSIKDGIVLYIKTNLVSPLEEENFIKEKLVEIYVAVGKAEWSSGWTNFIQETIDLRNFAEPQVEISILIFKTLIDDIYNHDAPNTTISKKLRTNMEAILLFLREILNSCLQAYNTDPGDDNYGNLLLRRLITCVLETIKILAPNAPLPVILKFLEEIGNLLFGLFLDVSQRIRICEIMIYVLERNAKENKMLFVFQYVPLYIIPSLDIQTKVREEDYQFQKKLAEMLTVLGLKKLQIEKQVQHFEEYLGLMLNATSHYSYTIASNCLIFWKKFVKNPKMQQQTWFQDILLELLTMINTKMLNIGRPEGTPDELNALTTEYPMYLFSIMDFESEEEFQFHYKVMRSNLCDVYRLISKAHSVGSLEFIGKKLLAYITTYKNQPLPSPLLNSHLVYIEYESLCTEISCIVGALPRKSLDDEQSQEFLFSAELLKLLFEFNTDESIMIGQQVLALTSFGNYFRKNEDTFEVVLTKIIQLITFISPNENIQNLSRNTKHTRKNACKAFVKICESLPLMLIQRLDHIMQIMRERFESGTVLDNEKILLIEGLSSLSNGFKKNQKREKNEFLKGIIHPLALEWTSELVGLGLESWGSFLQFMGLGNSDPPQVREQRRSMIFRVLHSLSVIWSSSTNNKTSLKKISYATPSGFSIMFYEHPIADYSIILENVLKLIRIIHEISSSEVKNLICNQYNMGDLYGMDESVVKSILGTTDYYDSASEEMKKIRRCMIDLSKDCYKILSVSAEIGSPLFCIPDIPSLLSESVFYELEYLEIQSISPVLDFIDCFCSELPAQFYESTIPIITIAFQKLGQVITNTSIALDQRKFNLENSGEIEEIIIEKLLMDASLSYVNSMASCLTAGGTASPIAKFFVSNQPTQLHELLSTLFICMKFNPAGRKVVKIFETIITYIVSTNSNKGILEQTILSFTRTSFECLANKSEFLRDDVVRALTVFLSSNKTKHWVLNYLKTVSSAENVNKLKADLQRTKAAKSKRKKVKILIGKIIDE